MKAGSAANFLLPDPEHTFSPFVLAKKTLIIRMDN